MSDSEEMPPLEDDTTPVHPPTPASQPTRALHPHPHSTPPSTTCNPSAIQVVESDSSDDDDEAEWLEVEEEEEDEKGCAACLFCDTTEKNSTVLMAHMLDSHGFDLVLFVCRAGLDQVGYIKLINYVRAKQHAPEELWMLKGTPWDDTAHLTPVLKDDLLLTFGKYVMGWRKGMDVVVVVVIALVVVVVAVLTSSIHLFLVIYSHYSYFT